MEVLKVNVDQIDCEELACKILGLDYDEIDGDLNVIEEELYDQLEMNWDQFKDMISRLLPLIDIGKSPMTEVTYKGFADQSRKYWLVKMEV